MHPGTISVDSSLDESKAAAMWAGGLMEMYLYAECFCASGWIDVVGVRLVRVH